MKIIAMMNEKGGQGKTSMAVTLAALLSQAGYRVLLVDGDSQGHATLTVRVKREDRLYHLLVNNAPINKMIVPSPAEYTDTDPADARLWVLPSAESTALIDKSVDVHTLKNRLVQLDSSFDYVVIDTSPKIGQMHLMVYQAAEWLIYPVEMTYLPIQGLYSSFTHLADIQTGGARVGRIMGILPTKYRPRLNIQKQNLAKLQKQYSEGYFFSPLRFLTAWDEAGQMRRPINRTGYDHEAAPEAEQFVREVMQRMEGAEHA
jgi:chromosome partitioning protein